MQTKSEYTVTNSTIRASENHVIQREYATVMYFPCVHNSNKQDGVNVQNFTIDLLNLLVKQLMIEEEKKLLYNSEDGGLGTMALGQNIIMHFVKMLHQDVTGHLDRQSLNLHQEEDW